MKRVDDSILAAVHELDGGRCIVCGAAIDWRWNPAHHVLPKGRWPELRSLDANLVTICLSPCHANHESAYRRIRRGELPLRSVALAVALGGPALAYLDRHYPVALDAPRPPT